MNRIAETAKPQNPTVGMGCTILMYSDRHAATVVAILSPKRIQIQEDTAKRTDNNGMSESQEYTYEPNPNGPTHIVTLRKNGRWVLQGQSKQNGTVVRMGDRDAYYDYSF
jgi:hypothetical protein